MKHIIAIFSFLMILICGAVSCKKDKPALPDLGYNYFPDQVGKYVIYDVDSFYYDGIPTVIDTSRFQLKEKIQSIYSDGQNRPTIRLERYVRYYNDTVPYSALPWVLRNVWAENRTATTAEKVEENVRFIKLSFAAKTDKTWNGNAQNTNGTINYSYAFVDQPRSIAGIAFDSVLQVTQLDDNGAFLTQRQLYVEKYARNIGLVYKQVIDVNSQPGPSIITPTQLTAFYAIPILQRVTTGGQYTYTVNSFGIE